MMHRIGICFITLIFLFVVRTSAANIPQEDLVLWLDAGQGVQTNNESRVQQWQDQSSAQNHAVQGQVDDQPILKTAAIHTHPAVAFDGKRSFLTIPGLKIPRDTTIFFVCQDIAQTAGGSVYRPLLLADNDPYQMVTDGYGIGYKKGDDPGLMAVLSDGEYWDNFKLTAQPTDAFEILMFHKHESDAAYYRNGFRCAHGILNRHTKGPLGFHTGYLLGGWQGPDNTERRYRGMIAEVIVYAKALGEADRFKVMQYLSAKYDIPAREGPFADSLCAWVKAEDEKQASSVAILDHAGAGAQVFQAGAQFRDIPWQEDVVHCRPAFVLRAADYIEIALPEKLSAQTAVVGYYDPVGVDTLPTFKVVGFDAQQIAQGRQMQQIKIEQREKNRLRIYAYGDLPIGLAEALIYDSVLAPAELAQTKRYLEVRYQVRQDPRYVRNGAYIFDSGYSDQPYITTLQDGSWLCVITTSPDIENSLDRHLVLTRSYDQGRTWTPAFAAVEPLQERRQPSWATLFTTTFGRVYCFYNLTKPDRRGVDFCYKYSDDGGQTWSQRLFMPVPELDIDRRFKRGVGSWSIDEPEIIDDALVISWTKYGGPDRRGEGFFFCSKSILHEKDIDKVAWRFFPEGGVGIHNDDLSPLQEEHNIVPIGGDDIYCAFRTLDGYVGHAYSRDGGVTWTKPTHMTYDPHGTKRIKNTRACPRVFQCNNGKYLLWFHNHDGRDVPAKNKDRDFVWVSGGVPDDDGLMHWSEPELLLYGYDFRHNSGMSYPDLIEEDGRYWITETQKVTARIHEVDAKLLEAMWNQRANRDVARGGLCFERIQDSSEMSARTPSDARADLLDGGLTIELVFTLDQMHPVQVLFDTRGETSQGCWVAVGSDNDIVLHLCDGVHPTQSWSCDPGLIQPGRRHHVTFIVDGQPNIISVLVDGGLCDGGLARKYGWGRFSPELRTVFAPGATLGDMDISGAIHATRVYNRALLTSEAVGNFRAGQ